MFPRFLTWASIRGSEPRADRYRSRRPGRPFRPDTGAWFQLEGLEDRCLLSGISGYTEYTVPTASAGLFGIVAGPDGNLWFLENSANKIGMINPTTHAVTEIPIPTANANPWGIAAGPDGNIWFTEHATPARSAWSIRRRTPSVRYSTKKVTGAPIGITPGPTAMSGSSGRGGIGTINPTTHVVTAYPPPSSFVNPPHVDHLGVPTATSGSPRWAHSQIAQMNPVTHATQVFTAPGTSSGYADVYHITAGPDGNVWFTDYNGHAVGMINLTTDVITEYPVPTANANSYPMRSRRAPAETSGSPRRDLRPARSASINPATDAITEYPIPTIRTQSDRGRPRWQSLVHRCLPDRRRRRPRQRDRGVATLATSNLVVTQQPPSSVTAGSGFGLTVEAEDSSGNLINSFNGTVTVALGNNPGGATLGGTLTATASDGVAIFSGLSLTTAVSGYTLLVSGGGLGEGVTSPITVTPATASQMAITQEPPASDGTAEQRLRPTSHDRGRLRQRAETGDNEAVAVALASNPDGATLGGTLSVTASDGVATFSGLTLTRTASGYTLQALPSSGLTSATTSARHRDSRRGHAGGDHPAAAWQRGREWRLRPDRWRSRTPTAMWRPPPARRR